MDFPLVLMNVIVLCLEQLMTITFTSLLTLLIP